MLLSYLLPYPSLRTIPTVVGRQLAVVGRRLAAVGKQLAIRLLAVTNILFPQPGAGPQFACPRR